VFPRRPSLWAVVAAAVVLGAALWAAEPASTTMGSTKAPMTRLPYRNSVMR